MECKMTHSSQTKMATSKQGRIILHLICIFRDHKTNCHLNGIMRELKRSEK